ncbi:MAG: hypothetical protein J0L70_18290 [Leptolyngbya sp. UWPOB_LEPTO1]|uniref:hypothetical protein n=1 Tax=Leptolyngbya sp. UWPOB_LEPTO1 TaxID=2815653 RepID=UPI001AC7DEC8|nr:hypothetical protein [Leptolyngbya sp. UWPOB_LEPTO1]MBN8562485.1 hypothetical protein [Leptolyngbya sp. UWPOB_LEPTO1]
MDNAILENVDVRIDNSTIVIDPRPGHTGSAAHNLQPIIRAVQSTHPAAEQCDQVRLLVAGEYIEMQIGSILQQIA